MNCKPMSRTPPCPRSFPTISRVVTSYMRITLVTVKTNSGLSGFRLIVHATFVISALA